MKRQSLNFGIMILIVAMVSGCGGSSLVIKQKFEAKPKIAVVDTSGAIGRFPDKQKSNWSIPVPKDYGKVAMAVAEVLAQEWGNNQIVYVENWKETTGYGLVVKVRVSGHYNQKGFSDQAPYKYSLGLFTVLSIWDPVQEKTLTGLAGETVGKADSEVKSVMHIQDAAAKIPAVSILDQLVARSKAGTKEYVQRLKTVKE